MSERNGCLSALLPFLIPPASPQRINQPANFPYDNFPYEKKATILTNAEKSFYGVLRLAADNRYHIFVQVNLSSLLKVRKGTNARQSYSNRIRAKSVDFVLCDPIKLAPLLAIELDDKSHNKPERQERDTFVESACEAAGIPILRIPAQAAYNAQDLARSIEAAINR
jgi:hypothetical protein